MKKIHQEIKNVKNKIIIERYFYDYRNEGRVLIYRIEKIDKDEKDVSVMRIPLGNASDVIKRIVACLNE